MRTSSKVLLLVSAVGTVAAAVALHERPARLARLPPAPSTSASAAPAASTIADPLAPSRAASLAARAPLEADWASSWPKPQYSYSRSVAERGGRDPCAGSAPEATKLVRPLSRGFLFTGGPSAVDENGNFDLLMHINGEGPVRRELLESAQPFVLYTYTLPPTSSYAPEFAGSKLFTHLLEEITVAVAQQEKRPVRLAHVALSAWSAGFEGVRSILYQREASAVEAVLLIDGLHAPRGQYANASNLLPFIAFGKRAQKGERFFAVTHSSIPTLQFTSTTESAHMLIQAVGGKPTRVERDDGFGLELVEMFDSGNLHVRGYAGNDKPDHCAQLYLMRGLFAALHRYFHP